MFGIKTGIVKKAEKVFWSITKAKLSSDIAIRYLMEHFKADTYGHRADIAKADLGYGWIHYGLIRAIRPRRILCVGSRHGFVPAVLAQACKDNSKGQIDFVDPGYGAEDNNRWTGVGYWKTKEGKDSFKTFELDGWVRLYVMESIEFAKKFKKRKYEYIYIDGDHSYKGVSLD